MRPVRSPLTCPRVGKLSTSSARGLSTDDIAGTLVLSSETVRSHVKSILRKLRVSSRREAVAMAQELRGGMLAGRPGRLRPAPPRRDRPCPVLRRGARSVRAR